MELKQIKELIASMSRSGLKKLVIKKEGFELELEREVKDNPFVQELWTESETHGGKDYQSIKKIPQELPSTSNLNNFSTPQNQPQEVSGTFITSPMVGTFYAAPSPDEPFFVKVGDKVEKNTVVCIIEAMKVMNEIKANQTGVVAEILVDSSNPVEFGTKLFRIV